MSAKSDSLIPASTGRRTLKMEQHVVRKILAAVLAATCSFGAAAENLAPTVALTAPVANASFVAPAAVALSATADDSDGAVAKVEFFNGSTLVGTATQAPYTLTWNAVAAGTYAITAVATDDLGLAATSAVSNVTVSAAPTSGTSQVFYIHSDQINTAREISNAAGVKVWEADPEPFGANLPNENPSGQGTFTYNPRFPGQYFDRETGLHYNYYRDYDPQIGRYIQSDPIGLGGGPSTYGYVGGNPLNFSDPKGLFAVGVAVGIGVRVVGGRIAIAAIGISARRYGPVGMVAACVLVGVCTMQDADSSAADKPSNDGEKVCPPRPDFDWTDPSVPPVGPDGQSWPWRGPDAPGGPRGGYVNPSNPDQSAHPDLSHPAPVGPHWDFTDRKTGGWRVYPDGTVKPK